MLFIALKSYAGPLKEILEIEDISSLCAICEKLNETSVSDDLSCLVSLLHHNDRDFEDCCTALVSCKKLSSDPTLKSKDEALCIECIRCILGHLSRVKSCIYGLYKSRLNEFDREFFEKLDVPRLIKKINKIEQRKEPKNGNVFSNCAIACRNNPFSGCYLDV